MCLKILITFKNCILVKLVMSLNKSAMVVTQKYWTRILSYVGHCRRICLTVRGELHDKHCGQLCLFNKNAWVTRERPVRHRVKTTSSPWVVREKLVSLNWLSYNWNTVDKYKHRKAKPTSDMRGGQFMDSIFTCEISCHRPDQVWCHVHKVREAVRTGMKHVTTDVLEHKINLPLPIILFSVYICLY